MTETRTRTSTYNGPDAEAALAMAFPQYKFTKPCECDAGIMARQEFIIYDDKLSAPTSLTILCIQCQQIYTED